MALTPTRLADWEREAEDDQSAILLLTLALGRVASFAKPTADPEAVRAIAGAIRRLACSSLAISATVAREAERDLERVR